MIKEIIKRKKLIFLMGERREDILSISMLVLQRNFSIYHSKKPLSLFDFFKVLRSDVIIFEDDENIKIEEWRAFFTNYNNVFCVITEMKKRARAKKFLRNFSKSWNIILDFSVAKKIKDDKSKKITTFGIEKKSADFYVSDINQKEKETNFKVNDRASIIPFWIEGKLTHKEIYGVLSALCIAKALNLNLVQVSYYIKEKLPPFTN